MDLLSFLEQSSAPLPQKDHFKAAHLIELFQSKIAKSRAAGKDGVRVGRFEEVLTTEAALIEKRVASGSYKFTTFKERLILRGADREPRQISIPTVRDRLTLRAICQLLHSHVPDTRGSSPHALVSRVAAAIRTGDQTSKSFVRVDVKNFFPSISHAILEREMRHFSLDDMVLNLCSQAVSTPTGSAKEANPRGIPQGLSISGALSSLYMIRFDKKQLSKNTNYFRYVDDILLICDTKDADSQLESIGRALSSRGLIIHKKGVAGKTEISPVKDGVDFLGYRICESEISIRSSSYRKMFKNLLKVITDYNYRKSIDRLIFRLNLKITGCQVDGKKRGWMMFFSYTEDKKQLSHLDAFVRAQLIRCGFPENRLGEIKRFIKTYHEIRFNLTNSAYIPNFDAFNSNDKAAAIAALSGGKLSLEEVGAWDVQAIEQEFSRLISREVQDLEQDVGNFS
ncbi:reverse transcriptase domain-containing protein [Sphingomonas sp. DT-207]|uniref:reverse transcriptase domain-containing protein n=1 Tax=Sphingomonas sp. DT-207 TaxID=3396167 RepID=UPI003F1B172C